MIMKSGVIFDLFGVVCEEIGDPWIMKSVPEAAWSRVHTEILHKGDVDLIDEAAYWEGLSQASGQTPESIRAEWYANIRERPGMFDLIADVRTSRRVGLCTNVPHWLFEKVEHTYGLRARFDAVIVSAEIRARKPDSEIYQIALQKLGTSPENTVFVDDKRENVAAAEAAGMRGMLCTEALPLSEALGVSKPFAFTARR